MNVIRKSVNLVNFLNPLYRITCVGFLPKKCYYCRQSVSSDDNIVKSPLSHTPVPNLRIDEYLFDRVGKWANKTAVVCAETGKSFTFDEYRLSSERLAHALCSILKFKKGDVIAVYLPNVPEYLTIFLGTFQAGIIVTTINVAYTSEEISRHMIDSAAKAIITLTDTRPIVEEAIKNLKTSTKVPIITVKYKKTDSTPAGTINFEELCEYKGPKVSLEETTAEDLAVLPYSSGTSGLPKGVQLIHRNIVSNLTQIQHEKLKINYDTTETHQDVVPIVVPIYHAYAMIPIMFNMFSEGCKCVLLTKYRPNVYLELFEKYPPTIMHVVPPIMLMLINNENAKRHHLKRMRHVICAAAPLASSDIERFQEKFGDHIRVSQYYGLTETGPVTHAQILDRETINGSIGNPVPLVECRIVSIEDESTNLGPNENGHLILRGPNIMLGYHNNRIATEETIDKDGWFKTGDIGYYNEDGVFFITDRIKELIKVKGFQVAPAELEAIIRDHPEVDDVAVTSTPHEQHGEAPKAFVVPRRNANVKPEHIQDYVKVKVAKHKHLTGGVVFVDSIPKNPSGKILRRLLKNM